MKFAVDRMLGRLAKWLRLLGYDAIYDGNMDANSVWSYLSEGRTVLTRGRRFRNRFFKGVVWVENDRVEEQLRQLMNERLIDTEAETRLLLCSRCNTTLLEVSHKEIEGRVPEYVMHSQKTFLECPSCQRIYWKGTHLKRMDDYLNSRVTEPTGELSPSSADVEKPS